MRRPTVSFGIVTVLLVACSSNTPATDDAASTPTSPAGSAVGGPAAESSDQKFPNIIDAQPTRTGDTWTFAVTVSSPYDTPARYANGWRILGPDGTVYGEHALDHDHASEQPFTRTQPGVPRHCCVGRPSCPRWGQTFEFRGDLPRQKPESVQKWGESGRGRCNGGRRTLNATVPPEVSSSAGRGATVARRQVV